MAKINWSKALADYLKDGAASYTSIASKYAVSLQAVKKRASKENWQDLRRKSIQKVNQELPEKIGGRIAEANARQAKIGKWLQWQGIKAIAEKQLEPKNFTQARDSIKEGIKIESEALESASQREPIGIFNREDIYWEDDDPAEKQKQKALVAAYVQRPIQKIPDTPAIDLQLLAKVQERLIRVSEKFDEVKNKLETRKTENNPANDRLTGWF